MSDTTHPAAPRTKRAYPKARPKVPPFARYEGTSAWRKYPRKVKAYALYRAAVIEAGETAGAVES